MFTSVLIANRGEIACRIARTAKRMGLRTIAVFSDADAKALHVRSADEAHRIGPAPAAESYLRIDALIAAAKASGAQCIHPGYGFLSENADFAQACLDAGIAFVGPPPAAIRAMGLKSSAKALMEKAGVPVVPGYHGDMQDAKFLQRKAYEIGYPVLIKAVAGGGGRGMRRVDRHADFDAEFAAAQREARSAFGDERVLIEKYVSAPRHIEIQVFADWHGNAIHLNERDCSLQRRHQKVIEEAPAPGMSAELRAIMGEAAVAAAKAVGYRGAGTVEFIADGANGLRPDGFWFMEMNTRLQVEHPVTEAITGLDLVEWQFRVAAGEPLPLTQDKVRIDGHAIEGRLYAEDPAHGFLPSTGRLVALEWPDEPGVRIDTGVESGAEVTPYYDPMIAKVIAHAPTRTEALDRLARALEQSVVIGPRTNVAFLAALCRAAEFRGGAFDTGFIDRHLDTLVPKAGEADRGAIAAAAQALVEAGRAAIAQRHRGANGAISPWDIDDAFQFSGRRKTTLPLNADGHAVNAEIEYGNGLTVTVGGEAHAADARVVPAGDSFYVLRQGRVARIGRRNLAVPAAHGSSDGTIVAPMHGKVLAVFVEEGARVVPGQRLAIIEAMKMEHTLTAPVAGIVETVAAAVNDQVAEGAAVVTIKPEEE